jgi:hypothetical protein
MQDKISYLKIVRVTLKGDDDEPKRYTQKFSSYQEFVMKMDDEVLLRYIADAKKNCFFDAEEVIIDVKMQVV